MQAVGPYETGKGHGNRAAGLAVRFNPGRNVSRSGLCEFSMALTLQ